MRLNVHDAKAGTTRTVVFSAISAGFGFFILHSHHHPNITFNPALASPAIRTNHDIWYDYYIYIKRQAPAVGHRHRRYGPVGQPIQRPLAWVGGLYAVAFVPAPNAVRCSRRRPPPRGGSTWRTSQHGQDRYISHPLVLRSISVGPTRAGAGRHVFDTRSASPRDWRCWGTLIIFPSLVVYFEFVLGWKGSSWGSMAYTQMDDLALLQVVSLFGLGGLSFLLASSSAVAALLLDVDRRTEKKSERTPQAWSFRPVSAAVAVAIVVITAQLWGSWRLDRSLAPGPMVTVASVGSDMVLPIINWPSRTEIRRADNVLFERTRQAAEAGAAVVVWNEDATVALTSTDEAALLKRGEVLARKHGIDIVMGYTVPLDDEMRSYENKYSWMGPEGVVDTYNKHHPVPGLEKCVPGVEPIRVLNRTWGQAAGAICYDYDFPDLAMAHARGGAGVVMVPASDWRGIDQFHTRMASVRGIEGGFSVVRSVRDAASGAYDALGRTLATLSWYDEGDGRRIMLVRVPVTPIPTLYSRIGDVLPWSCLGLVIAPIVGAAIRVSRRGGLVKRKVKAA